MADNRMYLRCKHCGKKFMLAKCTAIAWWNPFEPIQYQKDLNKFLEDHCYCNDRHIDKMGIDFDICYEHDSWCITKKEVINNG